MYTYPPHIGQEAPAIAAGSVLRKDDWLVPSNRDLGAWYLKGVTPKELFMYYRGHEVAQRFEEAHRILPVAVPIASQMPHAAGVGYGIKFRGEDAVVLTFSGDGGTSEGDFHEALNFAAVWKVPLITIVQNNQYAISVPVHKQTASKTLAAKALSYGMPGIRVDGNDYPAMYEVLSQSVDYARSGKGPVLIEAFTYRRGAHTTSDDPKKYRTEEEDKKWEPKDPVDRLRKYLVKQKKWNQDEEEELLGQYKKEIDAQFREAENYPQHSLDDVFAHMYAELTPELEQQKREYREYLDAKEREK
jgi:pyruvate dehydrogenase E1 component alpha subunit